MRPWMIPWLLPLGMLATVVSFSVFGDRTGLILLVGFALVILFSALRVRRGEDEDPDAEVHYWRFTDWGEHR